MSKPNTAGTLNAYEICVIVNATLDDKKSAALVDKYLEIVTNDGGIVENKDVWGRRTLAYEINRESEGNYVIVNFRATSATTDEFTRRLGLDESTLRYKVFRKES